jgi:hypothetical protein
MCCMFACVFDRQSDPLNDPGLYPAATFADLFAVDYPANAAKIRGVLAYFQAMEETTAAAAAAYGAGTAGDGSSLGAAGGLVASPPLSQQYLVYRRVSARLPGMAEDVETALARRAAEGSGDVDGPADPLRPRPLASAAASPSGRSGRGGAGHAAGSPLAFDAFAAVSAPLLPITVHETGSIDDSGEASLRADFANEYIGGGTIGGGAVQEVRWRGVGWGGRGAGAPLAGARCRR